jgi:predicted enzyme related to lactoylglutathione lyase
MLRRTTLAVLALCFGLATASTAPAADFTVGAQYDTTHVYVAPADFDGFVASFVATFGGTTSRQGVFQVTPTPSQTMSQLALTPAGTISVFGFKTPVPYPFGAERTGYLVTDFDAAVAAAHRAGADVVVAPFDDPIGRDAVVQWPGGVNMQLYWHTTAPNYAPLATIPENRVYVSPAKADEFVNDFLHFSHGSLVSDGRADGAEIGLPGQTYRRIRIESGFGKLIVFVTDGHLPWPYGREITGYAVGDLDATLARAKAAGVTILVEPLASGHRKSAMVQFPGGYVAEIHADTP